MKMVGMVCALSADRGGVGVRVGNRTRGRGGARVAGREGRARREGKLLERTLSPATEAALPVVHFPN